MSLTPPNSAALLISLTRISAIAPKLGSGDKPGAVRPAGMADRPNQVRGDEINEAQRRSVEKGLEWLAKKQAADGGYAGEGGGPPASSCLHALAKVAEMGGGFGVGEGAHGARVRSGGPVAGVLGATWLPALLFY